MNLLRNWVVVWLNPIVLLLKLCSHKGMWLMSLWNQINQNLVYVDTTMPDNLKEIAKVNIDFFLWLSVIIISSISVYYLHKLQTEIKCSSRMTIILNKWFHNANLVYPNYKNPWLPVGKWLQTEVVLVSKNKYQELYLQSNALQNLKKLCIKLVLATRSLIVSYVNLTNWVPAKCPLECIPWLSRN